MLSEDVNEKTINIAVRIGDISKNALKAAVQKVQAKLDKEKQKRNEMVGSIKEMLGSTTFKELSQKSNGLTTVELSNPDLRMLNKTMKKHGVKFEPVKDGKGKYILFFKGQNKDCIYNALNDYSKKLIKLGKPNPSIRMNLDSAKAEALTMGKNKSKEKNRSRGGLER